MLVALSANVSANPTLQCPHMLLHPPSLPSDFGLAEELTPPVRHHFISFLHMISRGERGCMRGLVDRLQGSVCVPLMP